MPWIALLGGAALLEALEVGLAVIAAALILLMLAELAKTWLEPLIASTANRHAGGILRILDLPGRFIRHAAASAFSAVVHSITVAASHRMKPLARWFHAAGTFTLAQAGVAAAFAGDLAYAFERTTTVVIPREIGKATRPLSRRTKQAIAAALAAAAAVARLRRYTTHALHTRVFPELRHLAHAADVAIPRALGRIGTRVRNVEREFTHPSTRWLRRIARAMWATTLLGLMIRTLARRLPWLFCRKTKTIGNRLCGLDDSLIQNFILGTITLAGTVSIVEFVRDAQAVEEIAVDALRSFIREA